MNPRLHRLLTIQGELLDQFLSQNLSERFAYVILVTPADGPLHVAAIGNLADRTLIEPIVEQFGVRIGAASVLEMIDVSHAQAMEWRAAEVPPP